MIYGIIPWNLVKFRVIVENGMLKIKFSSRLQFHYGGVVKWNKCWRQYSLLLEIELTIAYAYMWRGNFMLATELENRYGHDL